MPGCDGAELGGLFAAAGRRLQHRQYPHLQRVHRSAYIHGIHGDWCRGPQVEVVVDTSVDPLWSVIRHSCWFLSPKCRLPPGCDFSLLFSFTALLWFSFFAFLFLHFLSVWRISMLPGLWAFSWSVKASLQLVHFLAIHTLLGMFSKAGTHDFYVSLISDIAVSEFLFHVWLT